MDMVKISVNLNTIESHSWIETTDDGCKCMSRTVERDILGNVVREATRENGSWTYEVEENPTFLQKIRNLINS
jgi:hypothetical protein